MRKRRRFTKAFKAEAVRPLEQSDKSASDLARELGIRRNLLYKWQEQVKLHGEQSFPGSGRLPAPADEVARLRRELSRVRERSETF